jgi:hypothetical protein
VNDVTYLAGQDTPTSGIPLTATLSDGGVVFSSGDMQFVQPAFGIYPLPIFNAARAKLVVGSGDCRVVFVGDSTGLGAWANGVAFAGNLYKGWHRRLKNKLTSIAVSVQNFYGDSGTSVGSSGSAREAAFKSYDTRLAFTAEWVLNIYTQLGGFYLSNSSGSTGTITFTPDAAFDTIDVYYTKYSSGYGSFTIDIGAGVLATVNCNGGVGYSCGVATVSVASGIHAVNITKTVNAPISIRGISCYKKNAEMQLFNASFNGMTAVGYTSGGSGTNQAWGSIIDWPAIAPHLTVITLGINDSTSQQDLQLFHDRYQEIINLAKATGDVILAVPNSISYTGNPVQDPYWDMIYKLGRENSLNVWDHRDAMGSWIDANARGLLNDQRHPREAGYEVMSEAFYRAGVLGR